MRKNFKLELLKVTVLQVSLCAVDGLTKINKFFIQFQKHAETKKCRMFVDAEQTYFQGAIRRITVEMQRAFNKNECTVMNTYQNYLKVS